MKIRERLQKLHKYIYNSKDIYIFLHSYIRKFFISIKTSYVPERCNFVIIHSIIAKRSFILTR